MTSKVFNETVDLLLDAYSNNKLIHGNCASCAVGNICKGNTNWNSSIPQTFLFKNGISKEVIRVITKTNIFGGRLQISSSDIDQFKQFYDKLDNGITFEELDKIEEAFETSLHNSKEGYNYWTKEENEKQGQLMGLTAVINVMKTMIDDNIEVENRVSELNLIAKEKFDVCLIKD